MIDALHYLKEYQEKIDEICTIAKVMADSWELRKQTMAFEDRNEPLSWDELKGMEGKPVWVEVDDRKEWGILSDFYTDMFKNGKVTIRIRDAHAFRLCEKLLGKTWNAYRKERG